jgi:oligogalacturonide lyase
VSKGQRYLAESRELADAASGRRVRQITSHPSIHHHPFFFVPAYDQAMSKLVFVSYRTGKPQIFFEDRAGGELVQATHRPDLADWSIIPSGDGRYVYFTAGTGGFRINLDTFEEEQLADFGAVEMREKGMVGAAMGTTALSKSGRWWAVPVKSGPVTRFMLIDTAQKTSRVFLERDIIGHPLAIDPSEAHAHHH